MKRLRFRLLLAGAVLFGAGERGLGAPLPFLIVNQDGQWKSTAIQKEVAPGIDLEIIVTHLGSADRLVILSSSPGDQADSLAAFAHRVKDSFTGYQIADLAERDSTKMGYFGRDLSFQLLNGKTALSCELFVFSESQIRWAVLYSKPGNGLEGAASAFDLLLKKPPLPPGGVEMEPFRVKSIPLSGFPISFRVNRLPGSDHVAEIKVTDVPTGTTTERDGVKPGDAIVAIDGRPTTDFLVGVSKDSQLGRIFLNRNPGDRVELEIQPMNSGKPYSVTLRIAPHPEMGMIDWNR